MAERNFEMLVHLAEMVTDKISSSELTLETYISTENMIPNRGGVRHASKLPTTTKVNAFLPGDILFSNIRTYFKKVWLANRYGGASADVIIFRPLDKRKIDSHYLYYVLSSDGFIASTVTASKGTKMPRGDKFAMGRYEVGLPTILIQQKIAAILSAYDDLIENNLRRIKILEEMAQNLYREWFVKFRFPGHEHVRMVDSPLGKIPEEWEVVKVEALLEKLKRKRKIKKQDYQIEGEIPVVDQGKSLVGGFTSDGDSVNNDPLPIIVFGDHTRILKFIDFPFVCGADGTQLLRSNTSRMPMSLFYSVLLSIDLSNFAYARHFKHLKEQKVLLPDERTAQAFADFANRLREQIRSLIRKNNNLRQTRDLLLPKLISGELDVSKLDIATGQEAA